MAKSQIQTGALLSYLSIFIGSAISILYTPFMLRLLGQDEYGLMSLANSVVGYLSILNMGLGSAMVRYLSKYRARRDFEMVNALFTLFLTIFSGIAIVILLCGLVIAFNVGAIFDSTLTSEDLGKLKILVLIMTANMAMSMCSGVFYAVMMAYEKFVFIKVVGIINTVVSPLIMLPLLYSGYKAIGLTVASSLLNLINILIIVYYIIRILDIRLLRRRFDKAFLKELFGFSFFVFFALIVDKVYWGTDQFILGAEVGTASVAVYSVGATFMTYFMSFSTAISGLFLPRLTAMTESNADSSEFSNLLIRVGRIQFLILALILGGFILFGRQFIMLWAGDNYEGSFIIAVILIVPFIVPLIQNIGLQILYAKNKHKFRSIMLFVIAIFNVVFSIFAAKRFGGVGCAAVTAISFVIGQILILNWYYYKVIDLDIPRFWRDISILCIPFLIILAVGQYALSFFDCGSWPNLFICAAVYVVIYLIVMFAFGMNGYERSLITNSIPKLKRDADRR